MDTQQPQINIPIPENSSEGKQNPQGKKSVIKFWLPLVGIIILIGVGIYYGFQKQNRPESKSITVQSSGVTREQKLAQLNERERQTLEAKLLSLQEDIKQFNSDTSQEDKDKKYIQISGTQRSLGLYEDAISSLSKVSTEYKNQGRVNLSYALVYKDVGDLVKTSEYAKKATELDSGNPQAWVLYLESDQNLTNIEREAKYQEAILKTDHHEDVLVSYAKFLEKIGNIQEAIKQYQKAGETNQRLKPEFDKEISRLEGAK